MLQAYFRTLYQRTMHEAYRTATEAIIDSIGKGSMEKIRWMVERFNEAVERNGLAEPIR